MSPSRRTILQAGLATCLLAGCVSNGDEAASTPSPDLSTHDDTSPDGDSSPTGDRSPGTGTTGQGSTPKPNPEIDCAAANRPVPSADVGDEVEPLEYPAPPDGDVDAEWAVEHERAYVRNETLARHDVKRWHGTSVSRTDSESVDDGLVVRLSYLYGFETADAVSDSPTINVAYYVDDRGAIRAENEGGGTAVPDLDPTREGMPVVCF